MDTTDSNIQKEILEELKTFMDPIIGMGLDEERLKKFFSELGWNLDAIFSGTTSFSDFAQALQGLNTIVNTIESYIETPPETISDFIGMISSIPQVLIPIIDLSTSISSNSAGNPSLNGISSQELGELSKDLIEGITLFYIGRRSPKVFHFLNLFGIIRREYRNPILNSSDEPVRNNKKIHGFRFDKVPQLFSDPSSYFQELYELDFSTTEKIGFSSGLLLENIGLLLSSFNVNPILGNEGLHTLPALTPLEKEEMATLILEKTFEMDGATPETIQFFTVGALFRLLSDVEPNGRGLRIEPFGNIDITTILGNWKLALEATASPGAIDLTGTGVHFVLPSGGGNLTDFRVGLGLTKLGDPDLGNQALLIGSTTGTRFEIKEIGLNGFFEIPDVSSNELNYGIKLNLSEAAFVIQGGDGDGFISKILPEEGLRLAFDMGLEYTNEKGFRFEFGISSGTALELLIPLNITLFNVIDFKDVRFRLSGESDNKGITTSIGGTIGVSIGPFRALVENMGVNATFNLPESGGGNLGPLDLDFGFKPPSGIAMSIDSSGFKGGGFLTISEHRYVGALQLKFASGFNLSAICIITTKLPGGEEGFSLLILITVEFSPALQVGMGLAITGFGGILALHRSIDTDAVRGGLKNGMLESILFPQDILGNPEKIISDLESAFPIEKNHFVFGPMIKATWGDKSLVNISFGIMLELPDPVIMLPGLIGISLFDQGGSDEGGSETIKVLDINIAFLGIIDIPGKMVSIDASIYNSKILTMTIEGDMAFRLTWGENPVFVLSLGGFHPSFTPPPLGLSNMNRLAIIIFNEENLKLYAESYLAITSNTFQFGAGLFFYAKFGPLELDCAFGLDTIFFFNPFSMEIGVFLKGAVLWDGKPLLSISASANLSGPSPWHIYGHARIVIGDFLDLEVKFDEYFGDNIPPTTPTIELRDKLREALLDPQNWMPIYADGQHALTTPAKSPEDLLIIPPMGSLKISQNIMPLEFEMEKFGTDGIAGPNRFEIESIKLNGQTISTIDVEDLFAPMEFQTIENKTAAVEAESYEKYTSGVRISSKSLRTSMKKTKALSHELILVDPAIENLSTGPSIANTTSTMSVSEPEHTVQNEKLKSRDFFELKPDLGAMYQSPVAHQMELNGNVSSRSDLSIKDPVVKAKRKQGIKVHESKFKIVDKFNHNSYDENEYGYALAKEAIKNIDKNGTLQNRYKIVPVERAINSNLSVASKNQGPEFSAPNKSTKS